MGSLYLTSRSESHQIKMIGLVLLLVAAAAATPIEDCGSRVTDVVVDLNGCESVPCQFHKGQTVKASISFTETAASDTYKNNVRAIVGGIPLPWPGFDTAVCDKLSVGDCPGEVGEKLTYSNEIVIAEAYPVLSLTIDWHMEDADGNDAVCFQIPAEIVA